MTGWQHEPFTATPEDLRGAIRTVFYPAIPEGDVVGQERVDRTVLKVLAELGVVDKPIERDAVADAGSAP